MTDSLLWKMNYFLLIYLFNMVMLYRYVSLLEGNTKIPSDKNPSDLEHHHLKKVNQGTKCAMASTAIKLPEGIIKYAGNG